MRDQRGAVAIEAGLVISFLLVPLLLGVLYYGFYLWKLQQVPLLAPNLDQAAFVGAYCEADLLARVKDTALVNMENIDDGVGMPLTSNSITTSLVNAIPGQLGVDVRISVKASALSASPIPLPLGGQVVNDITVRLENIVIKTTGC